MAAQRSVSKRFADGQTYSGAVINDKFHGYGVFTYRNGQRYEGQWYDGKRHGYGTIITPHGDRIEATWTDNIMQETKLDDGSVYSTGSYIEIDRSHSRGDGGGREINHSHTHLVLYDLEATNVPELDAGSKKGYGSDPYVRISLVGSPKEVAETNFIRNERNPRWRDRLTLQLPDDSGHSTVLPKLKVQLFDKDWNKEDDFIADAILTLPAQLVSHPGREYSQHCELKGGIFPAHLPTAGKRMPAVPFSFKVKLERPHH